MTARSVERSVERHLPAWRDIEEAPWRERYPHLYAFPALIHHMADESFGTDVPLPPWIPYPGEEPRG